MGAMAATFSKAGANAASTVLTMLKEMQHRGTRDPRVAGQPLTFISQFLNEAQEDISPSKTAVGSNSVDPILGENYMLVLEGQFFPPSPSMVHQVMHEMARQPVKKSSLILKQLDGSYTFAVAFKDRVLVGRSMMGTKPLYYGENETICAVATERKALWRVGIARVRSFPPGNLAVINQAGFSFERVSTLQHPPQTKIGVSKAAERLRELLERSVQDRVSDVNNVAVAFSGGVDSALLASLAKNSGVNVHLICVGLRGQSEIDHARKAGEALELPLTVKQYTIVDVEDLLPKVLWLIEEPKVMKAGVAIAFYWAAEAASKLGLGVLLAGQGADELFGGYRRYLNDYANGGPNKVREVIFQDTTTSYETNFQRDEPVCAYHNVELRLPFVEAEVVRFALSLPTDFKIRSASDQLRKRVLRLTAENMGIPEFIASRPKKAIQFATGVDKALEKLARREGLTQESYLNRAFGKVYPCSGVKTE